MLFLINHEDFREDVTKLSDIEKDKMLATLKKEGRRRKLPELGASLTCVSFQYKHTRQQTFWQVRFAHS